MPSNIKQSEHKVRPLSELRIWDKNPRRITKEHFENLKAKIQKRGLFKALITTPDGLIIGGNMRFRALQELGVEECWCSIYKPKDEADMLEVAISDNEAEAEWVQEELSELIHDQPIDFDLYSVNLGKPVSLADMLGDDTEVEEVEVDETNPPVSKPGEIYKLGDHRLMCGDSTDLDAVAKLMDGELSDMIFTDPPYNVDYGSVKNHPSWKRTVDTKGNAATRKAGNDQILNDKMSDEAWIGFVNDYMTSLLTFNNGAVYICMSNKEMYSNKQTFENLGGHWASFIIWKKDSFVLSMQDYHRQYEPILYGWKEGGKHYWCGDRDQSDIWEVKRPKSSPEHPTMKPIELCARAIKNSSKTKAIVMDLFGGSGSTLIACEQLNRQCYMCELDCKYIDVIIKRWMKFTGERAYKIIDADGKQCNEPVQFADESFMELKK